MSPAALALPWSEAVAFSAIPSLLAVSLDRKASLVYINPDEGRSEIFCRIMPENNPVELAFSPNGLQLAIRFEDPPELGIVRWETDTRLVTGQPWESRGFHLRFSPCGKYLITGYGSGFRVLDVHTGRCEFEYAPKGQRLRMLECDATGEVWLTAHGSARSNRKPVEFRRWRWPFTSAISEVLPYRPAFLDRAALSPNGELLAAVFFGQDNNGVGDATLQVYSLTQEIILHEQPCFADDCFSSVLRWAPNNRVLGFLTREGVAFIDFAARKEIASVTAHAPADLAFSPDGSLLAITGEQGFVLPVPLGGELGPVPTPHRRR